MNGTSKYRWYQFRLRTLLIAVLVLSLPLSWLAPKIRRLAPEIARGRRQQRSVQAIEQLGGVVVYDNKKRSTPPKPPSPWLRRMLGKDSFRSIEIVGFRNVPVSDNVLALLEGFTDLRFLNLNGTLVTDEGLKHLMGLTNLEHLSLQDTLITDAGLDHLNGLTSLRTLTVNTVTKAGVTRFTQVSTNCSVLCEKDNVIRRNEGM